MQPRLGARRAPLLCAFLLLTMLPPLHAAEQDALAISYDIQTKHLPFDTVMDPIFASSDPDAADFNTIVSYDRHSAGDSAIWTGHYLAAEAFRYNVTGSLDALSNMQRALAGIQSLRQVTGYNLLARFKVPATSPLRSDLQGGNTYYPGAFPWQDYVWVGNTTRDQYSGVFFGLAVAFDAVADSEQVQSVRSTIANEVTLLLSYLLDNGWNVKMPNGIISTSFLGRYDQQLTFLQIGRHVNPAAFESTYVRYRARYASVVPIPISIECLDTYGSYYKFNLDHINLYNLIRLEEPTSSYRSYYLRAFRTLRSATGTHQNAHFNLIDRAINGPNATRDQQTRDLLNGWLQRPSIWVPELGQWVQYPRRDYPVDLTDTPVERELYPAAGDNRAVSPVPVARRPTTDFLWQRSPLLLRSERGTGTIEYPGIDYILPYWMARSYNVPAE